MEYLSSASYSSHEKCVATKTRTKEVEEVKEINAILSAKIITKPQSTTVSFGRFRCDIDGVSAPRVTWLHEGTTIVSSHCYQVPCTQYKPTFEIISVEISDEGNYSVIIKNSEGTQEAKFTLTIHKPPPKEEIPVPLPSVKSPGPEVKSPEPAQVTSPEPRVKSHKSVKSPESVSSPPTPIKSPEPVPPPHLVFKSPEPITSPSRVKFPMTIKSPESITSPMTECIMSPKRVKFPTPVKSAPPKIVQQLQAEAFEGKVKMYCIAESMVKEAVWYNGSKKIIQSSHYQIQTSADGSLRVAKVNTLARLLKKEECPKHHSPSLAKCSRAYSKVTAFVATHLAIQVI
ncbi:titin-like [Sardina pilchardus]|uniref:titin-like n=1 Tax=Sardina pilchardus TaxID=27697 RepID=UPI002E14CBF8